MLHCAAGEREQQQPIRAKDEITEEPAQVNRSIQAININGRNRKKTTKEIIEELNEYKRAQI